MRQLGGLKTKQNQE